MSEDDESGETPGGDVDPADAFAALGDPTRVDIVRALAEHRREDPADPALGFADLRRAVGVHDSGRFRYHLEELRDRFVEKTDEGYRLTPAGVEVATAIIAGTFTGRERRGPAELDGACPACGEPPTATYDDGVLAVTCGNDHLLFVWGLPPSAARDSTVGELVDLATVLAAQGVELARSGTCPECYVALSPSVEAGGVDGPTGLRFEAVCPACGARVVGPLGFALLREPAAEAFAGDHGRSLRGTRLWELSAFVADGSLTDGDDAHAAVVLRLDGEELRVDVDEAGRVVDAERTAVDGA